MKNKKLHLWKGQYCSFVDVAKLESISYDVLKKAFYKLKNIEKAVEYAKEASSIKERTKYEYKGAMYIQKDYCELIAKDTGLTFSCVKSRVKNNWSLEDILNTPMYKLTEKTRKNYQTQMGAQVKVYDLNDNLLYEFNTYNEAAKFLKTTQTNIVNTCHRFGVFANKYKIRSKSSSSDAKEKIRLKIKANNDNWCRINYPTPELNALASKRCREITYDLYYKTNKNKITQKVKEYYCKNFDVKQAYQKKYFKTNRDYLRQKHKEWIAKNKVKYHEYHKNYRKYASSTLSDVYIKTTLATTLGLKADQITPEMIDIKRKQLIITRKLKN
jgi:predicted secreted protein